MPFYRVRARQRDQLQGTPSPEQAATRRHSNSADGRAVRDSFWGSWVRRSIKARWARTEALPKVSHLIHQDKLGEAYALALKRGKVHSGRPGAWKALRGKRRSTCFGIVPADQGPLPGPGELKGSALRPK
jgi:hypothetical protein